MTKTEFIDSMRDQGIVGHLNAVPLAALNINLPDRTARLWATETRTDGRMRSLKNDIILQCRQGYYLASADADARYQDYMVFHGFMLDMADPLQRAAEIAKGSADWIGMIRGER